MRVIWGEYQKLWELPEDEIVYDDPRFVRLFFESHAIRRHHNEIYVAWHNYRHRMVFTKFIIEGTEWRVAHLDRKEAQEWLGAYLMEELL